MRETQEQRIERLKVQHQSHPDYFVGTNRPKAHTSQTVVDQMQFLRIAGETVNNIAASTGVPNYLVSRYTKHIVSRPSHCPQGHALTIDNIVILRKLTRCKTCPQPKIGRRKGS
ncbi:hypothetical protein N9937_00740 [bacterium]|nr:hypothetical protein [bacterium]